MRGKPLIAGAAGGMATVLVLSRLAEGWALGALAALLGALAGGTVARALSAPNRGRLVRESTAAAACIALAVAGLWTGPGLLGIGYLAHGVWDALRHREIGRSANRLSWWPTFCLSYDGVVGFWLLWGALRGT